MKEEDRHRGALVVYRLQRARETLGDAHLLCEREGSLWSVINRAYYAMLPVLGLLTSVGKGASKHSGVLTLFDEYFIKPGHLPREMSKAIHKAFELRQIGDYRELATLDEGQATEILTVADEFVDKVDQYLEEGKNR
jgi:uncharacterized protein (UPF0332 family)